MRRSRTGKIGVDAVDPVAGQLAASFLPTHVAIATRVAARGWLVVPALAAKADLIDGTEVTAVAAVERIVVEVDAGIVAELEHAGVGVGAPTHRADLIGARGRAVAAVLGIAVEIDTVAVTIAELGPTLA